MKKLLAFLLLICGSVNAQITLENTYTTNVSSAFGSGRLGIIHLSASGYKYMVCDTDQIVLYNLNHSIFKTISVPSQPSMTFNTFNLRYVSEELFNTNANDVEYIMTYATTSNVSITKIYDENGNLIFYRDSAFIENQGASEYQQRGIQYTSAGVKMILRLQNNNVEVYSLPGTLPCTECTSGVMSGFAQASTPSNPSQYIPDPYPNPTNSTSTISYLLPDGTKTGQIIFYDMTGNEVKRFSVSNEFNSLIISSVDLTPGIYYYTLETNKGTIPGKQVIVTQ